MSSDWVLDICVRTTEDLDAALAEEHRPLTPTVESYSASRKAKVMGSTWHLSSAFTTPLNVREPLALRKT